MVIKVNLLYLCQILKFHNFNFYMTDSLDILIPVFNEDEEINKTLALLLNNVKCDYNLNICYDYDEDPTLEIVKKKFPNNPKIKFIKNEATGFNGALITGIKRTNGNSVIVYMADDHENHNLIDQCIQKFNDGYDLVCPSRFIAGGKMEGNPIVKEILTRLASLFFQYFTTLPIKDSTNSFRLFSRKFLNKVNKFESSKGFTLSLELTAKAHRMGFEMIEIPSVWIERKIGESRFRLFKFLPPYIKWLFFIIQTSIFYRKK